MRGPAPDTTPHSGVRLAAVAVQVVATVPFLPLLPDDCVNRKDDQNFVRNEAWRGLSLDHLQWMLTTFHCVDDGPLSWPPVPALPGSLDRHTSVAAEDLPSAIRSPSRSRCSVTGWSLQ